MVPRIVKKYHTFKQLVIGTRRSRLALWQTNWVKAKLESAAPGIPVTLREVTTAGDQSQATNEPLPEVGGKGLFTAELEQELLRGAIRLAVHSLKDLPTEMDPRFVVAAICERHSPDEVLISRANTPLSGLPVGATVGTSSLRRGAQVKQIRPDLVTGSIRGNVETRIRKVRDGEFDAVILAAAGVERLELHGEIAERFDRRVMLPAPGQGALAVQCRAEDAAARELLSSLDHCPTRIAVTAERAFLHGLEAGCSAPVAAFAELTGAIVRLHGRCFSVDGRRMLDLTIEGPVEQAETLGFELAKRAIGEGFPWG